MTINRYLIEPLEIILKYHKIEKTQIYKKKKKNSNPVRKETRREGRTRKIQEATGVKAEL